MWLFGHLGIGAKIAAPLSRKLPYGWLLLGTVLPDLIDKPLYYGLSFVTGKVGYEIGLISCTRSVGHTGFFTLGVTSIALLQKSKPLAAVALGLSTHLFLDGMQDYWVRQVLKIAGESSLAMAALFPFYPGYYSAKFAEMPTTSLSAHLKLGFQPIVWVTEALGLAILGWDYWKLRWNPKRILRSGSFSQRPKKDR